MNKFFSIITVVLNDKEGLIKTGDSLLNQNFSDFEWIVIDGASRDGTREHLESLTLDGFKWISREDNGIYDAMNSGLNLSNGKYVVFMNAADIFFDENVLAKVKSELENQSALADVVFGHAELLFPNHNRYCRKNRKMSDTIWHGLPAVHQATYYKREALSDFEYDLTYKVCGDYYIAAYLYIKNASELYIDSPLVIFSVGGFSFSKNNRKRLFFEPYKIQKEVLKLSFLMRLMSLAKRGLSTVAVNLLSNSVFRSTCNPRKYSD